MGSLEISQDMALQRRTWRAERIGWTLLGALLLAAVLGLFGSGPLAQTETSSADGRLVVEHPRFARAGAPLTLRIRTVGGDDEVRVRLSRDYFDSLAVERITPEPERMDLDAEGVVLRFAWTGGAGAALVTLEGTPETAGPLRGRIGAAGAELPVSHFLYP